MTRTLTFALALCLLGAVASPSPRPASPIAIVINGVRLPLEPPPIMVGGELFVPVRLTIEALGLPFVRSGSHIETQVGAKSVSLSIGSRVAEIDGEQTLLDAAPIEVKYVLYVPLRFFTDILGAQASFDRAAHTVTIVAQLVGRSADGLILSHTAAERFGTVTAVDLDSDPPTVTLEYNATIHTVPIGTNAIVDMRDVDANVVVPGELSDVRPGDFTRIFMNRAGHVERVEDAFGSHTGRIVAATDSEFVLTDGQVIVPDRTTQIILDGRTAALADLQVGDLATVRYNVESNEVRSILVSRSVSQASPQPGGPQIASLALTAEHPLRAADTVDVTMNGTPGGAATFDIGSYVTNLAMSEHPSGVYAGSYQIPPGANFSDVPIIGHLRVGNVNAPDAQAANTLSASSTPPGIADFAPGEGAVVNTNSPAIYATFAADAVPVNPSSIILRVDGRDVSSESLRTPTFVQYMPSYAYRTGTVRVSLSVADLAGNTTTKSWTFTIQP